MGMYLPDGPQDFNQAAFLWQMVAWSVAALVLGYFVFDWVELWAK